PVPHRLPGLAAVVGALDQLPEPARALRHVQSIRVSGRSLEVVYLPAPEVGTSDVPPCALSVRLEDERALACANQHPYPAHLHSFRASRLVFAGSSFATSTISASTRAGGGPAVLANGPAVRRARSRRGF